MTLKAIEVIHLLFNIDQIFHISLMTALYCLNQLFWTLSVNVFFAYIASFFTCKTVNFILPSFTVSLVSLIWYLVSLQLRQLYLVYMCLRWPCFQRVFLTDEPGWPYTTIRVVFICNFDSCKFIVKKQQLIHEAKSRETIAVAYSRRGQ